MDPHRLRQRRGRQRLDNGLDFALKDLLSDFEFPRSGTIVSLVIWALGVIWFDR
jgi:hypothetical protein